MKILNMYISAGLFNKKIFFSFYIGLTLLCIARLSYSQTYVPSGQLNSPNMSGSYYHERALVLGQGFSTAAGLTFNAYISNDCVPLAVKLSNEMNYLSVFTARKAGIANLAASDAQACEVSQAVTYFDFLGRPIQQIAVKASVSGSDIIQPVAYDVFQRQPIQYLPYTTSTGLSGSYHADALNGSQGYANSAQKMFYSPGNQNFATTDKPYAVSVFNSSPLNRINEQGLPGIEWQPGAHSKKIAYLINNNLAFLSDPLNSRQVALYTVDQSGNLVRLNNTATYAAGELLVNVIKSENWTAGRAFTTEQYTDKFGRTVLTRSYVRKQAQLKQLSTYYIYDDQGDLRYILPPKADPDNTTPTINTLNDLCYQYKYDKRRRVAAKKIAGLDWELFVYNRENRMVMSQNGRQRINGIWAIQKYDHLGRPVYTAEYTSNATQTSLQDAADVFFGPFYESFTNAQTNFGYSNVSYPQSISKVLIVNYYDNYDYLSNSAINPSSSVFQPPPTGIDTLQKQPAGALTATKINVLGTNDYLFNLGYYNTQNRPVKLISNAYKGGVLTANNLTSQELLYDFTGQILRAKVNLAISGATTTQQSQYFYDNSGRLLKVKESYNGGNPVTLSAYEYNELNQVSVKHQGSKDAAANPSASTFLQHFKYKYNLHGRLTHINDPDNLIAVPGGATDIFAMRLHYNDVFNGSSPLFDGKITSVEWQTKLMQTATAAQEKKAYNYIYDDVDQLTNARFTNSSGTTNDKYNEEAEYDLNGNIQHLRRRNASSASSYLNDLTYNYGTAAITGNRLLSVADAGTEGYTSSYEYDNEGSVTSDSKKGLYGTGNGITYNSLGLPARFKFASGKSIDYIYAADGHLLRKVTKVNSSVAEARDYIGGAEYTDGNGLEFIYNEEGRAMPVPSQSSFINEYKAVDFLGNTRAYYGDKNNNGVLDASDILQNIDYYPFGREINYGASVPSLPNNQYKFGGKEMQPDLEQYDFEARFYDPIISRWNVVDPLAENFANLSPYNYANNNPAKYIDPTGMGPEDWYLPEGVKDLTQSVWFNGSGAQKGYQWVGKEGYAYDEKTGNSVYFGQDGLKHNYTPMLDEVKVVGERTGIGQPGALESVVPVWGATRSSIDHFQHGEWVQGSFQAAMAVSDLFLVKSIATAGIKLGAGLITKASVEGSEVVAREMAEKGINRGANSLTVEEITRIENAATRIGKPINVVGSRASGAAKATSDWDYVIEGLTNKQWKRIKNSLPGAPSKLDNFPRMIDIFKGHVDPTKPFITILPK